MFKNHNDMDVEKEENENQFKKYVSDFLKLINSTKVGTFIIIVTILLISLFTVEKCTSHFLIRGMVENELASLQTSTAVMANEFSEYLTIHDAEKGGVYDLLKHYSAMNYMRIRVIDERFVIVLDSYYTEYSRSMINPNVLNSYKNKKNIFEYNKKLNSIEAVVPIINSENTTCGVIVTDMSLSKIISYKKSIYNNIYTAIIAVMIVSISLIYLINSVTSKRYKRLYQVIEEVAAGHVDKRLPVKGTTEMKELAIHFNTVMDKANSLDESRQEFVSNVSHELKTPITSIKVLADSLNMQEDAPIELYKEFMQDIVEEIDRESKIIDDLLTLVKMDKKAVALNIASINLNELMELVLKRLKPIAEKKNVEILFESFRPVVAEVDEVKFTQVVSNLVENAIKYNNNDGWVHVSLNADYQYFYVRVEDSGIGIPKESQELVFDRFYRVDKARSRETGGTGLGLAIVQNIILMHHGIIKLYSEEGQGTTFTVRIPLNYVNESNNLSIKEDKL